MAVAVADHPLRLHTSVPGHDEARLRALDPEGIIATKRLKDAVAGLSAEQRERVVGLSVTVHDVVDAMVLDRLPSLRCLVTRSTGHDHLPLDLLHGRGIIAYHLGDYGADEVADHALGLTLALLRRYPEAMAVTKGRYGGGAGAPSWRREALVGRGLLDVTVGVLGAGRIGGAFARRVIALGGTVVAHDIVRDPSLLALPRFRYVDPFETFLASIDVLSIHVPLIRDGAGATYRMVDAGALQRLPRDALVVNTARGDIIDHEALLVVLRRGHIAGFATDVLPGEPDPPLLERFAGLPNVLIAPHLGAYDESAIAARYRRTVRVMRAALGQAPLDEDVAALRVA